MNFRNKNFAGPKGFTQPLKPQSRPSSQFKPVVAQPKVALNTRRPVAPAVYRPQQVPKVLQQKKGPVAPPVYRPQPVPKVLQAKTFAGQKDPPRRPVVPPAHRPNPHNLVQPKAVQLKPTARAQSVNTSRVAPPAQARPTKPQNGNAVVQRMIGFEYELEAINTQKNTSWLKRYPGAWVHHQKGERIMSRSGYDITADINSGGETNIEFITRPIDESNPANILRLRAMARDIAADIRAIHNASHASADPDGWVGANQVRRLNGWWWHRFQSRMNNWHGISGQLQMTGGVRLGKLHKVLSGSALGQEPMPMGLGGDAAIKRAHLTRFYESNPIGNPKQPIYQTALAQVTLRFGQIAGWNTVQSVRALASVIALMAQVPIEKRGGFPPDSQGLMLAKTDYSKILLMLAMKYRARIPENAFRNSLVATINAHVPPLDAVNADSDIFPAYYSVAGTTFGGLTIRDWVDSVLPEIDPVAQDAGELDFMQGQDKMTRNEFPGTQQQKKEMRAFGTFGNKTDPGGKVILEFRNFTLTVPDELEAAMAGIAEYLGTDVNV